MENKIVLFQGPFFVSDFRFKFVASKIKEEALKHSPNVVILRGPFVSLDVEPYAMIKERRSVFSLLKNLKESVLEKFQGTSVQKVIFIQNGTEMGSVHEYPLEVKTKIPDYSLKVETTCEEFKIGGMYVSFFATDPISLAWNHMKYNRHNCKGNPKKKMLDTILEQKSRCPLIPQNTFVDPRNIGRCHTFGKPLDMMVLCSRKYSSIEQCGGKIVLSTQPFVTNLGFRQYSVIGIDSPRQTGEEGRMEIKIKIQIQGVVDPED